MRSAVTASITVSVAAVLSIAASGCGSKASMAEEKAAIMTVVHTSLDKPNAPVVIDPILVRTDYGVADWIQGDTGGRTLLKKEHGTWKVLVNAGEEMRDAAFIEKAGVPTRQAKALFNSLIATERQVPEEKLAKFDRNGKPIEQSAAVTAQPIS